jgi:hypothetical protein
VRWRLEFYSERQQILAHCRVETPATALALGRRRVLDEYPVQRVASQQADAWVLYRIQQDD